MEAPGRVRGMRRRHQPRGQPHFFLPPNIYVGRACGVGSSNEKLTGVKRGVHRRGRARVGQFRKFAHGRSGSLATFEKVEQLGIVYARPPLSNGVAASCACKYSTTSVHRPASAATHKGLIAMGRIGELVSIKPRSTGRRQGLRKLSPDLISKARDETATQVTRIGLTFLGTAAFCLLSLLSPDSVLLGGSEKINVPLAGPVSFFGFMLLGPTVLIVIRVYLQIYVEYSDRLDR